jgi:hypothetical protein
MGRKKSAYPDLPPGMTARRTGAGLRYYYQVDGKKIPLGGSLDAAVDLMNRVKRGISSPEEARFGGLAALTPDEVAERAANMLQESGVYFLLLGKQITYIGQSRDVWRRIKDHAASGRRFDSYCWQPCEPSKLIELEAFCIKKFHPIENIHGSPFRTIRTNVVKKP